MVAPHPTRTAAAERKRFIGHVHHDVVDAHPAAARPGGDLFDDTLTAREAVEREGGGSGIDARHCCADARDAEDWEDLWMGIDTSSVTEM